MLSLAAPLLLAIQPGDTWYGDHDGPYYPAFWSFGAGGVSIFDVTGNLLKTLPNTQICQPYESGGAMVDTCNYYRAVSDGRKYVFASNTAGSAHSSIQAFSMETGMFIGDLETCGFPYSVEYAPHREEVWTHCWSPDHEEGSRARDGHPGDEGHIDVFSTNALGLDHEQVVLGYANETGLISGHGHVQLDALLPNYGYATALTGSDHIGRPGFYKIPLNKGRHAKQGVPMPFDWKMCPGGFYRFALNGYNKHAYLRCMVCCSCGEDKDTQAACSTRGGGPGHVNITTGPGAGTYQIGHCGHSCENSLADVVGMIEYDLLSEGVVGTHEPTAEANKGNSAPHVSPRGDYVVMMGGTGSHTDVLKTKANGELSVLAGSIATGFRDGGGQSITDVEFVEDDAHNIAIFAATTDNFIVLADMRAVSAWDGTGAPPAIPTRQINLQEDNTESSSGHGRGQVRSIVWAPKTNQVMINSGLLEELHILTLASDGSIDGAAISRTISGVSSKYIVYVNNYETPHAVCDTDYWEGPAMAAGWSPPCSASSRRSRRLSGRVADRKSTHKLSTPASFPYTAPSRRKE